MTRRSRMIKWGVTIAGVAAVILCLSPAVSLAGEHVYRRFLNDRFFQAAHPLRVLSAGTVETGRSGHQLF